MIFVTTVLLGDVTLTGIDPQNGTIGLLFTTSIAKRNAPINSTAKVRNARTESARRYPARNASKRSFRKEAEQDTQTGTWSTPCGIPKFTHWVKWASSALWP